jgi:hypothetical protein
MMAKFQAGRELPTPAGRRILACALGILLVSLAHSAAAQAPKKYLTPDGKTIYSDKPIPGATLVGDVYAPPPANAEIVEAARAREAALRAEVSRRAEERLRAQESERQRIDEATAALERARRELNEGRTPTPGERIGTAGGGTRFTDEYVARQQSNEDAVKRAEEELTKTRGR